MNHSERSHDGRTAVRPLERESTGELLTQFFDQTKQLVRKEVELAKLEAGDSVKTVAARTVLFAIAGLFGLTTLGLLAATAVLALATVLYPWAAALIVAGATLVIALIFVAAAKAKKVRPMEETQRTLKEDVQWAKERMA